MINKKLKYHIEKKLDDGCYIISYFEPFICLKCQKIFNRKVKKLLLGNYLLTDEKVNTKCNKCGYSLTRYWEVQKCKYCGRMYDK